MTKENLPTIRLDFKVKVDLFDLIPHILCLDSKEIMEFIRQLDASKEDWDLSEMIIAYGKELETWLAEEKEAEENPSTSYDYWVQTDGANVKGQREAKSVNALLLDLKREGFIVHNIEEAK